MLFGRSTGVVWPECRFVWPEYRFDWPQYQRCLAGSNVLQEYLPAMPGDWRLAV